MKETIRNPKYDPSKVNEVSTRHEKKMSDPIKHEKEYGASHNLVMNNP